MDVLDTPNSILGWTIKTRMQITLTWLIPSIMQLLVYVTIIAVDCGLVVQHLLTKNLLWGYLTLSFIIAPALLCFIFILLSPTQWPEPIGWSKENRKFLGRQIVHLIVFPVGAIYR